ncbi:hypothetical protein [Candidatus Nanohalococcus occultus]|uniref:hypothetical protein n=1 Tax=Candidatus Nanohalococcus occultus TaxID=2978047 RepID=UPI0039DFAC42
MSDIEFDEILEERGSSESREIDRMLEDGGGYGEPGETQHPDYSDAMDAMEQHMEMLFEHRRKIDQHNRMIDRVFGEYEHLVPNFRAEYLGLMDTLIDHIEDRRAEKKDEATADAVKGLGFMGAGGLSALAYSSPGESLVEFYASSPDLYSQPEIAAAAIGLPAVGLYMFKRSFDKFSQQSEYLREKERYQRARRQFEDRGDGQN